MVEFQLRTISSIECAKCQQIDHNRKRRRNCSLSTLPEVWTTRETRFGVESSVHLPLCDWILRTCSIGSSYGGRRFCVPGCTASVSQGTVIVALIFKLTESHCLKKKRTLAASSYFRGRRRGGEGNTIYVYICIRGPCRPEYLFFAENVS